MAFFYSFTETLKHKWLQFFQVNRDWIKLHMEVESVYTPDGGKRPPSYLILGVANALEPKLAQLMLPFSKLNPDADTLIEVLGLHFDPDMAIGNYACLMPQSESLPDGDEPAAVMEDKLEAETLTIPQTNHFVKAAIAHDLEIKYDHEENLMVSQTMLRDELRTVAVETQNEFGDNFLSQVQISTNESQQVPKVEIVDDFGEISFDELKEIDSKISASAIPEESGFAEVLQDVWGDETASFQGESNTNIVIGEEDSNHEFDDSEIASLFPNT